MSFDLDHLRDAVARHGRVARVVVADTAGSVPREPGASLLVWDGGQEGTIGGGTLEWAATARAREALAQGGPHLSRHALGPDLGQCCGGRVTLVTEVWDAARLAELGGDAVVRPVVRDAGEMPLSVARLLSRARNGAEPVRTVLRDGWMVEPLARPARCLWIWGAGHVGRALVEVLAPLPDLSIVWIDTAADRFPETIPPGVALRVAADPAALVPEAPAGAEHLVLTYSHALDLALCHALLSHGFAACGLIGSDTKWARFRSRLGQLGHAPETVARIRCPIGRKGLGKHPQAIAIGVAADILAAPAVAASTERSA